MSAPTTEGSTYRHPHPAVAVDLAIFSIRDGQLCLLLIERGVEPFKGRWALPGGFVRMTEDLQAGAQRELLEETGISQAYLEQVGAFGRPDRDPRERVISVGFYAIIASDRIELRAGSDARLARWWPCDELPALAFDHSQILARAREQLKDRVRRSAVALQFLPPEFTLTELQLVHELILGEKIDKRNFRKWVTGLKYLHATGRERRGGPHRPAALFRARPNANALAADAGFDAPEEDLARTTSRAVDAAYRKGFLDGLRAFRQRLATVEDELSRSLKS